MSDSRPFERAGVFLCTGPHKCEKPYMQVFHMEVWQTAAFLGKSATERKIIRLHWRQKERR